MKVIGLMLKNLEWEFISMLMAINLTGNGKMMLKTVGSFTYANREKYSGERKDHELVKASTK